MANSFIRRLKHLFTGGIQDFLEIDTAAHARDAQETRLQRSLDAGRAILGRIIAEQRALEKERDALSMTVSEHESEAERLMGAGDENAARLALSKKVQGAGKRDELEALLKSLAAQQHEIESYIYALESKERFSAVDEERLALFEGMLEHAAKRS